MITPERIQWFQSNHPNLNIPDDPSEALTHLVSMVSTLATQNQQLQTQLTAAQQENIHLQSAANDGQTYRQEWYDRAKAAHTARFGADLTDFYVSLFDNPNTPAIKIRKFAETWESEVQDQGQHNGNSQKLQPDGRCKLLPKVSHM